MQRTLEQKERIRTQTSKAMKKIAERDKCSSCLRKSAMTKTIVNEERKPIGFKCRFCGFEEYFWRNLK